MSIFMSTKRAPRIGKDHIIEHLSQAFEIPASAMTIEHNLDVAGWRGGKPEKANSFIIRLKQPLSMGNLHHDMHEELVKVFAKPSRIGVPLYFGVVEDKDHKRNQWLAKNHTHPEL